MPELFQVGMERLIYKSKHFATGKTITAYIWSPLLVKSSLQTFNELELGLYYLDYNFSNTGTYFGIFYEEGIAETVSVFRVIDKLDLIHNKVDMIKKIESGRWKILNKQLLIYDDDNTTVLLTFDLKDKFGNPAETNVFERDPV